MSPVSSLSSSARPRAKYKVGDIVAMPSWDEFISISFSRPIMPEIFKITAVEYYGSMVQYRTVTLNSEVAYVMFGYPILEPIEWWVNPSFFQNGSGLETQTINIRLPLLIKYGIH